MKRRVMALFCSLALAFSLSPFALAAGFTDVKSGSWYYDDVMKCVELGLMSNTSSTYFSPDANVTRAMVVTTLWRLEGSPDAYVSSMFPDAAKDSWYYTALSWAKGKGIATGYSNGNFGPNDKVTREQLANFLYRYADFKNQPIAVGVLDLYSDAGKVSKWAAPGVKHALGAGLITGNNLGELDPLGLATRKELAVILVRLTTPVAG